MNPEIASACASIPAVPRMIPTRGLSGDREGLENKIIIWSVRAVNQKIPAMT